jgi:RimJ/RimL family protein N-acetyltransferase
MKHGISIEGYAYALRPIELEDAKFVVDVRTPKRTRYMHEIERTVEAQRAWLEEYFARPNEYYFVIQRKQDQEREGLTSLLDFDQANRSAQWGRLILRPGSFAAAETALLMLQLAFDTFGLDEVWGIAVAGNTQMIAYAESFGFEDRERVVVELDGRVVEGIKHVLTKRRWKMYEKKVRENARSIAYSLQSRS